MWQVDAIQGKHILIKNSNQKFRPMICGQLSEIPNCGLNWFWSTNCNQLYQIKWVDQNSVNYYLWWSKNVAENVWQHWNLNLLLPTTNTFKSPQQCRGSISHNSNWLWLSLESSNISEIWKDGSKTNSDSERQFWQVGIPDHGIEPFTQWSNRTNI